MTNDVLLNVEHVTKVFGRGERQFAALKDINLTIRAGAHRFKLDDIEKAYELFGHQRDGVLKVAITP